MRKISVVLVAAMLLSVGNLFANDSKNPPAKKNLSTQIGDLLENNTFVLENNDLTGMVRFTLNDENQIVVLSVDTKDAVLESFVKARLNYQKVDLEKYEEGKMYTVPVRIQA